MIRIVEVTGHTEDYAYRVPIKFGGVALDRVRLQFCRITIEDAQGKRATGQGCMPLGNIWAYPSSVLSYAETLSAMETAFASVSQLYRTCNITGHPIPITHALEGEFPKIALEIHPTMPLLAVLVAASPIDAALHDAFGMLHQCSSYQTYTLDAGDFVGEAYRGQRISDHLYEKPRATMPLYHLVGALDALTDADVSTPVADGLPETLEEWIVREGLTHFKIKLNGSDPTWDYARIVAIDEVVTRMQQKLDVSTWFYSLDFNEKCPSEDALLEILEKLKANLPALYTRVQYIEQPTTRDVFASPAITMHRAAMHKPIVMDESLLNLETLLHARTLGYTGVALKACKGQTQSLLMAVAARQAGMFLCVQDLTCPGLSLIHSAGLAAHLHGIAAIEANARQYCPAASQKYVPYYSGLFETRDGMLKTGQLTGYGLSFPPEGF
jgi:L-alanine-DL-glutamate epimerase-like enolase superfamily enzyme